MSFVANNDGFTQGTSAYYDGRMLRFILSSYHIPDVVQPFIAAHQVGFRRKTVGLLNSVRICHLGRSSRTYWGFVRHPVALHVEIPHHTMKEVMEVSQYTP